MSREVLLIYQDCPYYGAREEWGKQQMEVAEKNDITVRETYYTFPGAKELILEAVSHGIKGTPFYTDGVIFSRELVDFLPNPNKSQKNSAGEEAQIAMIGERAAAKAKGRKRNLKKNIKKEADEVVRQDIQ